MASFVKYNVFVEDLCNKVHDIFGTTDTLRIALTNTAPNVSTHAVLGDITEISDGFGYATGAGTSDTANDSTRSGATVTVTGVDVVFTASGGTIGPFRYAVLYNDTPSSPLNPLIGYWDYTTNVTLQNGETFTVDFGASMFTVA